jgi:ABC-2 type transport system permease protein
MNPWLHLIAIVVTILLPFVLAIVLRRRVWVPWLYFCVGVLTFVGAQLVHIPLNALLVRIGILSEDPAAGSELILTAIVLGLTAGLTEEIGRAVGYQIVHRARAYQDAIMMGLGHGGIEAMIFGGILAAAGASSLWYLQNLGALPEAFSDEQLALLRQQLDLVANSPLLAFAPLVERILALVLQVSLSVMVMQAFVRENRWYIVGAILCHAAVDAIIVYASHQTENVWLLELLLFALVLPLAIWAWRQRPDSFADSERGGAAYKEGKGVFSASLVKELRFQWRTKRVLIVCAIFLVFGMLSPLIAKLTPTLLNSLEGVEQFADLIPEPTIADAVGQYVKNITQFGFILAILLGMGAIAGEKEKGTAAMVLSKPLPRPTFVTSKFLAQGIVYLLAFALAGIAAYYYTFFLFGDINASAFAFVTFLLWLWLMVYVAVTLFGSAIARSTGVAAGIAVGLSVLILLAGSIPSLGALAPGGLVSWSGQLALESGVAPNAGAVATSVVLVVLAIVAAIAVLEEQEI